MKVPLWTLWTTAAMSGTVPLKVCARKVNGMMRKMVMVSRMMAATVVTAIVSQTARTAMTAAVDDGMTMTPLDHFEWLTAIDDRYCWTFDAVTVHCAVRAVEMQTAREDSNWWTGDLDCFRSLISLDWMEIAETMIDMWHFVPWRVTVTSVPSSWAHVNVVASVASFYSFLFLYTFNVYTLTVERYVSGTLSRCVSQRK